MAMPWTWDLVADAYELGAGAGVKAPDRVLLAQLLGELGVPEAWQAPLLALAAPRAR